MVILVFKKEGRDIVSSGRTRDKKRGKGTRGHCDTTRKCVSCKFIERRFSK